MGFFSLFILAIGLSMDAFAVAVCKGLAFPKITVKNTMLVGLWFGGFQALMPLIGYFLGLQFQSRIEKIDHWISFGLLVIIGANMIKESRNENCDVDSASLSVKNMFVLAVATSIDALAVGITLAFLQVNIFLAILLIGTVTFLLSVVGVRIGNGFGMKYKSKAELLGGVVLILLGTKILLEHLGFL